MCTQMENEISSDFIEIWSATDTMLQAVAQVSKHKIHVFLNTYYREYDDASQMWFHSMGVWSAKQATAH